MKKINLILILLLVISLCFNVIVARKSYRQYIRLRTPRSLLYYRTVPVTDSDKTYVLFLGDSRIQEWKPLPDFKGEEILNLGCGGAVSDDLVEQLERMDYPAHVQMAVIEIGINDLTVIGFTPHYKERILSECKSNITRAVGILRQKDIPVLLLPVLPAGQVDWMRSFVWSQDIDKSVEDINHYLASLREEKLILGDCSDMIGTDGRIRKDYARDTLHFNAKGYEQLNAIVMSTQRIFRQKRNTDAF